MNANKILLGLLLLLMTGSVVAQQIDYSGYDRLTRKYINAGAQGWAIILSSLKTLLETGEPLNVHMAPPQ